MSKFFDDTMQGLLETVDSKKPRVQRIYEDDDWVIDLIDGSVRVSYFENCHFVDEIILTKDSFKE